MKNKKNTIIAILFVFVMIMMTGCTAKKNQDNVEPGISVQDSTTTESVSADETEQKTETIKHTEAISEESTEEIDAIEVESEGEIELESGEGTVGM